MASLSKLFTKYNSKFSFNGGNLTNYGGLILVHELFELINLKQLLAKHLKTNDNRKYYQYSDVHLMIQLLLQKIAGDDTDYSCQKLKYDAYFPQLFEQSLVASQPTLSRFFDRGTEETVASLYHINMELVTLFLQFRKNTPLIIDVDSTLFQTFGNQEGSTYNAHYRSKGYHPLFAFESGTGYCLHAQLREGNRYCSDGADDFIRPLLGMFDSALYRMDSGFNSPKIYELIEKFGQDYLIKLKDNQVLSRLGDLSLPSPEDDDVTILPRSMYLENIYKAKSWNHERRICQFSNRPEGELLYDTVSLLTTLKGGTSEELFELYRQRGQAENFIKEIKSGFFGDKTDSSTMLKNEIRMWISCIAYNLYVFLKQLIGDDRQNLSIHRFRQLFLNIAGRIVKHAGNCTLKLSSLYRYKEKFLTVIHKISEVNLLLPVLYKPPKNLEQLTMEIE